MPHEPSLQMFDDLIMLDADSFLIKPPTADPKNEILLQSCGKYEAGTNFMTKLWVLRRYWSTNSMTIIGGMR